MSIKLRQIEIDSFRAYKDRQIFDFHLGNEKVANLVAIFAPNGFGKTSFFDAVEWSFTGEIDRIKKIPSLTLTNHGHLLKNVDSKKNQGEIRFIADNNEEYVIRTKKLGAYNRKTDYISGEVIERSSSFTKIIDSKFSLTNILAHDKIDTFLKFSSQKDRYETLSSFWDDNNDSITYKKILDISNEIVNKETNIRTSISVNENEIKDLIYVESKINYLNETIKIFNEVSSDYNENLSIVNSNMTMEDLNEFLVKCQGLKSELLERERYINKHKISTTLLLDDFPKYILLKKTSKELEKENEVLIKVANAYLETEKHETELLHAKNDLTKVTTRINKITLLRRNYHNFINISNEIDGLNKQTNDYHINLIKDTQKSIDIKNENSMKKEMIDRLRQIYSEIVEKASRVDEKALEFKNSISKRLHVENRIYLIKKVLSIRDEKDKKIKESINYYESILDTSNEVLLSNKNLVLLNPLLSECEILNDNLIDLKLKLKVTEENIVIKKRLSSDIESLLRSGSNLVSSMSTSNCPLCKAKYKDHLELIQRINVDLKMDMELQRLILFSRDLDINIKNTQEKIDLKFEIFKSEIKNQINNVSKESIIHFEKIANCRSIYEKLTYQRSILEEKIEALYSFVKEDIETVGEVSTEVFQELRNTLNNQAKTLLENIEKEQTDGDEKEKQILSLKVFIEEANDRIKMNQLIVNERRTNPEYVSVLGILEELSISSSLEEIDRAYSVEEANIDLKNKKINEIITELERLKAICSIYENTELKELLLELNARTEENLKGIFNFEIMFKDIFPDEPFKELNEDVLRVYYEEQHKKSVRIGVSIKKIETIINHLDFIEQNTTLKTKKNALEQLNIELQMISKLKVEMNEAREIGKNFLENKIKLAFNHRMINDIYSRIDPHPDLSTIEFKPDFNKDKMDINVTACGADNNERAPVLYFSSAQLNILSLSIFLARTFQTTNSSLNTIFMDDPIQHLDSINILSFIDLIRTITTDLDRQIVISTHNINFFNLLKRKINPEFYDSKFIELATYGSLK